MTGLGQFVSLESIIELVEKRRALVAVIKADDSSSTIDLWYAGSDAFSKTLLDTLKSMRVCTCISDSQHDAYSSGGPMSGKPLPGPCMVHPDQDGKKQSTWPTYTTGPIKD